MTASPEIYTSVKVCSRRAAWIRQSWINKAKGWRSKKFPKCQSPSWTTLQVLEVVIFTVMEFSAILLPSARQTSQTRQLPRERPHLRVLWRRCSMTLVMQIPSIVPLIWLTILRCSNRRWQAGSAENIISKGTKIWASSLCWPLLTDQPTHHRYKTTY